MDPLLTTQEVAARLKLSPNTVKKLWREGRLKGTRISERKLRFEAADVERFLDEERPKPPVYRARELRWREENRDTLKALVGQWVVLEGDQLIGHGDDPVELCDTARQIGVQVPFVFFVERRIPGVARIGLL